MPGVLQLLYRLRVLIAAALLSDAHPAPAGAHRAPRTARAARTFRRR